MNRSQNRILKNTFYLYIRSIISLFIKLYTSRLVLLNLGIEDFGVYQVVGGLVAMFSFLNGTMASATQRYISYEIGLGEKGNVRKVFSTTINIHILLGGIIFVLIEIIGQYLLVTTLNIGSVNIETAKWLLHFSALSTFLTVISVPYNSMLISKEDMSYFAYIDLLGVLLQFLIALALSVFSDNRLMWYSFLMFVSALVVRLVYSFVCTNKYKDAKYYWCLDIPLMKKIFSFSGWTTLSAITFMIKTQGIAILLNVFIGPLINAAVGIGNQVNNAIKAFSQNFQMSFMPQIVKKYAEEDYEYMNKLILSGAKLSTLLLIALSMPVIIECDFILSIWLKDIPSHSSIIIILILIETIFQTMTCTGNTAIRATGNVKHFELIYNLVDLCALPCIILWLYFQPSYYMPFVIFIFFIIVSNFVKIIFLRRQIPYFNQKKYCLEVLLMIPLITVVSTIFPWSLKIVLNEGVLRFLCASVVFELFFGIIVYLKGLNYEEKRIVLSLVNKIKNGTHTL